MLWNLTCKVNCFLNAPLITVALRERGREGSLDPKFAQIKPLCRSEFCNLHWDLQPPIDAMCLAGGSIEGGMKGGGAEEDAELPH